MTRFISVKASNFQSVGQQPIFVDLDTKNLRCILGNNEDIGEKGISANGVGKSTIFNAVIFCLFGKGIDKLKTDEFINIVNGKKLLVEMVVEKAGVRYIIRRGRKPNIVELLLEESGESFTLDAMRNTDDAIVDLIGYDYNTFMATVFLSPHRQSFMAMSSTEQRSMIEKMLSLDTLAVRAEQLKKLRSDVQVEIKVKDRDIRNAEKTNENAEAAIKRLTQKHQEFLIEKDKSIKKFSDLLEKCENMPYAEIESAIDRLDILSDKREEAVKEKSDIHSKIASLSSIKKVNDDRKATIARLREKSEEFEEETNNRIESARMLIASEKTIDVLVEELADAERHEDRLKDYNHSVSMESEYDAALESIEEYITELEDQLVHHRDGKCPVCAGDYVNEEAVRSIEGKLDRKRREYEEVKNKIKEIDDKFRDFDASVEFVSSSELRKRVNLLRAAISEVESAPKNLYIEMIDDEQRNLLADDEVSSICSEMETLEARCVAVSNTLDSLNSEFGSIGEYLSSYGIKNKTDLKRAKDDLVFYKDMLDKSINSVSVYEEEIVYTNNNMVDTSVLYDELRDLEKKETHIGYLIKLMTDSKSFIRRRILDNYIPYLNKKINEYAEQLGLPHVCSVNSDLSVDLTYMSRSVSYFNLSRGERLRLDMATTVAFRDMMGLLGKSCNIAMLDEVLDSALDASGIQAAMRFICSSAETVLLITHREELSSSIDDRIIVTKRNGFTMLS